MRRTIVQCALVATCLVVGCRSTVVHHEVHKTVEPAQGGEEPQDEYRFGSVAEGQPPRPSELPSYRPHNAKARWIKSSWTKRHPVLADAAVVGAHGGLEAGKILLNMALGLGHLAPMGGGPIPSGKKP